MFSQDLQPLQCSDGGQYQQITKRTPRAQYNDLPYGIAFALNYIAIIGLAVVYYRPLDQIEDTSDDSESNVHIDKSVLLGAGAAAAAGVCYAVVWFFMIKACAKQLIWAGLIFSVLMMGAAAMWAISAGQVYMGMFFALFCVIQIAYCYCVRHRIKLAVVMTEVSVEVGTHYPGMFVVAGSWILVNMVTLGIWLLSTVYTVYELKNVRNGSDGAVYGLMCYFILTLYWIAYVNIYIVHCVSAGVFGQWYFAVREDTPSSVNSAATAPALSRACTTSFGSICLGALIIATIELLNAMARQAQNDADSMAAQFVACCIRCLLECIGDIIRFINRYAFTICSIYGDDYCEGVKITMDVLQQNGFEAIINDDLVGSFLGMGAFVGGLIAAGVGVLVAHAEGGNSDQLIVVGVIGLLMGLSIVGVVSSCVISCVTSFWVCFALDPAVFHSTKPMHYGRLMDALAHRWGGCQEVPCYAYVEANCGSYQPQQQPGVHNGQLGDYYSYDQQSGVYNNQASAPYDQHQPGGGYDQHSSMGGAQPPPPPSGPPPPPDYNKQDRSWGQS